MVDITGQASSVLLVRDAPFEVLMVQRRASGQYASAFVFPGGVVDQADRDSTWPHTSTGSGDRDDVGFAIAAIRETWEEVSMLIGVDAPAQVDRSARTSFRDVVTHHGLTLNLDELHFFGQWLTPVDMPKRWDTRFLLARAPEGQEPIIDDDEIVGAEWIHPVRALELHESGERQYLYPTLMNLRRLAQATDVASAITQAQAHPRVTALVTAERTPEGVWRSVPAEAGYGVERHWTPHEPEKPADR